MKSDIYKINNAVEKIKIGKNTLFLDQREYKLLTSIDNVLLIQFSFLHK